MMGDVKTSAPANDSSRHHRRSIRLKEYDYSRAGAYFVTISARNRQCLFGKIEDGKVQLSAAGEIVQSEWLRSESVRRNVVLDEFVIMPNHVHGIIMLTDKTGFVGATRRVAPTRPCGPVPGSIGAIIGQFKSAATKRINQLRKTRGARVWQRNYYEHVLRNENELDRVREYMTNNPLRWELDQENPAATRIEDKEPWRV